MYYGFSIRLIHEEKTNIIWKITLIATLINIVLNVLFIPFFGFEVAAITTSASLVIMLMLGYYNKTFRKIDDRNYFLSLWIGSFIVLTLLSYFIVDQHWMIKLAISLVTLVFIITSKHLRSFLRKSK
jgi:O-antigen/teichoic acid export membrane protein